MIINSFVETTKQERKKNKKKKKLQRRGNDEADVGGGRIKPIEIAC